MQKRRLRKLLFQFLRIFVRPIKNKLNNFHYQQKEMVSEKNVIQKLFKEQMEHNLNK